MPTGIILNPRDCWSSSLRLAKDDEGRYILGDPAQDREARLSGLPCVITNTMPLGRFVTLDAPRTGYIADREEATVRIAACYLLHLHFDYFHRTSTVVKRELTGDFAQILIGRFSAPPPIHGNHQE